jgi:hypothetical protein
VTVYYYIFLRTKSRCIPTARRSFLRELVPRAGESSSQKRGERKREFYVFFSLAFDVFCGIAPKADDFFKHLAGDEPDFRQVRTSSLKAHGMSDENWREAVFQ